MTWISRSLAITNSTGRGFVAHLDELRIVVSPLSGENGPIIETDRIGVQVPLADESGLITMGLHKLW